MIKKDRLEDGSMKVAMEEYAAYIKRGRRLTKTQQRKADWVEEVKRAIDEGKEPPLYPGKMLEE